MGVIRAEFVMGPRLITDTTSFRRFNVIERCVSLRLRLREMKLALINWSRYHPRTPIAAWIPLGCMAPGREAPSPDWPHHPCSTPLVCTCRPWLCAAVGSEFNKPQSPVHSFHCNVKCLSIVTPRGIHRRISTSAFCQTITGPPCYGVSWQDTYHARIATRNVAFG